MLKAYQTMFGMRDKDKREADQSSTQPPPPTTHEKDAPSYPYPIEDQV